MSFTTRRIFVDSRHATTGDSRNFTYDIGEDVVLPTNSVCYILDISMPHSFYTVDSTNQNIYLIENENSLHSRRIELPNRNYDVVNLSTQLQTSLNQTTDGGRTGKSVTGTYTVTLNTNTNNYSISLSGGGSFRYLSESVLNTYDGMSDFTNSGGIPLAPLASTDDLFGLRTLVMSSGTTLNTKHLDIRNYHNLFLHSSSLTNYKTIGPRGVKSVIARIPVNSTFGNMIYKPHSGLVHDYCECGTHSIRLMQFSLRDANNKEVNLNGGNLSFTLLFTEQPVI